MLPLAITGGIAEGKSTVLEALRLEGLRVLSADAIVQDLWQEPEVLALIAEILDIGGTITKDSVRVAIAGSVQARRQINHLFHPLVLDRMMASDADAFEVPLLIETCLQGLFERVWVVTCGVEIQKRRLIERVGLEKAEDLLRLQVPTRVKIMFADEVIRTNGSLADVHTATFNALTRHRSRDSVSQ